MSGTMMDDKPQASSRVEPEQPLAVNTSGPTLSSPAPLPNTGRTTRENPLREVFAGREGLYSGTRWLIYLAMAWIVYQVEMWVVFSLRSEVSVLVWRLMVEGSMMLAATLPGFVMAVFENHPFGDFGLPAQRAFKRNFWIGTLWGIGSLSVLMLGLRAMGAFEFGSLALTGVRVWKFAAYYAVFFLFTAFFEDFLMRGYSQWVLAQGMSFWPAAAFLSFAFGYIHRGNAGESPTGLVAAGLIGFFLCLTLRRTGDLWWAVGFHLAWDWGESYLYAVPDSGTVLPGHLINSSLHGPEWLTGGSVGPEGSYIVFVLIGALWVLFDRTHPEVKYGLPKAHHE